MKKLSWILFIFIFSLCSEDSEKAPEQTCKESRGICTDVAGFDVGVACPATCYTVYLDGTGQDLGTLGQDFTMDQTILRAGEAPWANIWMDAGYRALVDAYPAENYGGEAQIDFFILEGGGFRIANQKGKKNRNCPVDSKGECDLGLLEEGTVITMNDAMEIFFSFNNTMQIRTISLTDFKDTLEVGAVYLPNDICTASGNGAFTQTSSQVKVVYDGNGEEYVGDDTKTTNPGTKVLEIYINNQKVYDRDNGEFLIDQNTTYKIGSDSFMWGYAFEEQTGGGTDSLRFWHKNTLLVHETTNLYSQVLANGMKAIADDNGGFIEASCDGRVIILDE
jgi:hypothetical protein